MTRLAALFIGLMCIASAAMAQTYTEHLKKNDAKSRGTVTIRQSAEIDALVNGKTTTGKETSAVQQEKGVTQVNKPVKQNDKPAAQNAKTPATTKKNATNNGLAARHEQTDRHENDSDKRADTKKREQQQIPNVAENNGDDEIRIPVIDTRKKVMRGGYKVDGYRVQAFAGGNSREDKNKAQQAGNRIKTAFPEQPIYVHFYSPRWICRVGNYRSMEEASRMLKAIQELGYKQAVIVKGKITVTY